MGYTQVLNKSGLGGRSPLDQSDPLPAASAAHSRTDVIRKMFAFNCELSPNSR